MILDKASQPSSRLQPPKVSLQKIFLKAVALLLVVLSLGLPTDAAPILVKAFADDSSSGAAPAPGTEQWMVGVYQEGKRLFDLGDFNGAQREWDKLSGSYDKNPSLKVIVDYMRKRIKEDPDTFQRGQHYQEKQTQIAQRKAAEEEASRKRQEAQELKKKAREKKSQSFEPRDNADAGVKSFLDQARQDVTQQVHAVNRRGATLDSKRAVQQMLALFTKGKEAYMDGNLPLAIRAWEEAVTYLPPNSPTKRELQELKMQAERMEVQSAFPQEDAAPPARKLPPTVRAKPVVSEEETQTADSEATPPKDMKNFLELVNARFRSEAQEGYARKAKKNVSASDRQQAVDRSFRQSKLLYFQGEYEKAIEELNALSKYFSPNSEESRLISELRENYSQALKAQNDAQQTESAPAAALKSPVDLKPFIDQVNRKFDSMVEEARARRSAADRTAAEREEFVGSGVEQARMYFSKGLTDEALAELERIAPYVENGDEILSLAENIRAKQAQAQKTKDALKAPLAIETKLNTAATKGITDFLKDAQMKIDEQTKKAAARKKEAEMAASGRSREMIDLFQSARAKYDAGDLEGALDLLSQMTAELKDGEELENTIVSIRADLKKSRKEAAELKALEAQKKESMSLPAELSSILAETRTNIRAHTDEINRKNSAAKQASDDRKRVVDEAYNAGRQAYNAGNLEVALREWEKLVPLVENGEEFSRYLSDVKRDYQAALEAEKTSQQSTEAQRVRLPDEFYELLNDTAAKARARAQKAAADRQNIDQAAAGQRQSIDRFYEAGRQAYNAGDLDGAVKQWKQLVPLVEGGQNLGNSLESLSRDYHAALKAVEESENLARKAAEKFTAGAELNKLLGEAQKQVETRGREAKIKKDSIEKTAAEKRGAYERALAEGKAAYAAGNLEEALTSWKALVPIVEDGTALERQITTIREQYRLTKTAVAEAEEAQKTKALRVPADIAKSLDAAQKDAETQSRDAVSKKQSLDKAAAERQAIYDRALAEGRAAFKAGNDAAALSSLKALVSVVEDGGLLEKRLADLNTQLQNAQTLSAAAEQAQKSNTLRLPDDVAKLLDRSLKDAEARANDALIKKQSLDKAAAERQAIYDRALAEGKAAYKAGDLEGALTAWKALVPVVSDGSALDKQLSILQDRFREAKSALTALESAKKSAEFQTPPDVSKLLEDAQKQVETRGREAATQKIALEKAAAEKRTAYERAVAEGKAAYKAGDLESALTAWQGLIPIVEDGASFEKQLAALREQAKAARETRQTADALAKQKVTYNMPGDLSGALADISKKLQSDIAQSRELAAVGQAKLAERQKLVQAAIKEGLDLYRNGLSAEAVKRWETILPQLEDSDRLQKAILDLQRAEQELTVLQKSALQSEIDSKKLLVVPVDLTKALDTAFASAKAKLEETKNRQTAANEESVRRQTVVTEAIQNGKLALARGEVDNAVAEWTKAAPYLQDGQNLIPKLQDLKVAHLQLQEAQKAAADAEERNQAKIKSLPEVETFVTESTLKYKNDLDAARVRKEQAEASYAEKKAFVEHTLNKAREIFEKGDIPGANQEALKIQPLVEDPVTLQAELGKIQIAYDESVKAQETASAAVKHTAEARFKAPPEMALLLKDADTKVKELTQLAMNQKIEAEQSLKEKEAFMQETFERGKNLYWQGKLDEALAQWDSLAPLLENGDRIKELNGRYEETLNVQRQAREMNERRNEKFQTPEELQRLLNDAEKVLQSQASFATAQQQNAQGELSERQEFINKTFQKGKALYEQGMIPDAIEEWEQLTPVLENGSKVKEFIDHVKSNYKDALSAKKGAEEAQARSIVAPQAPADLTRLLNEANQALQTETKRSQDERQKAEDSLREKQKLVDSIFQKGKSLYQAGRLEEAIDTWKTLLPYVDDNTSIRQLVQQAEDSRRRLLAERFESQNSVRSTAAPSAMQFALEETNMTLKDQISQQQQARITQDLQELIGGKPVKKPAGSALPLDPRAEAAGQTGASGAVLPFKLDEIEQMMLEYKVVTPDDLKKRREELKARAASPTETAPAS